MATLELRGIRKIFESAEIIKGIDLAIADHEFVVFVGPSGCGKSTLLRMIAGLETITEGDLLIDGARVNSLPPDARELAMVFQSYALYPHMSVAANMGFALKMAGRPRQEIEEKVMEAARILQLEDLLDRRPKMLSGGQRQRVAIGRAIVRHPKIFLFDEPLSNLDAALRVQMRSELSKLHQSLTASMIYVTHDQVEAMTMADRIVVLNNGRVEQVGVPLELYRNPATRFVAEFIGSPRMNMLEAHAGGHDGRILQLLLADGIILPASAPETPPARGEAVSLGLRPEDLTLATDGPLRGRTEIVEHLGAETLVHVLVPNIGMIVVKAPADTKLRPSEVVSISPDMSQARLFASDGKAMRRFGLTR